jgi:hypothetical protein
MGLCSRTTAEVRNILTVVGVINGVTTWARMLRARPSREAMALSGRRATTLVAGSIVVVVLAGVTRPGDAPLRVASVTPPSTAHPVEAFHPMAMRHQMDPIDAPTPAPPPPPAAGPPVQYQYSAPVYRAPAYPVVYSISIPSVGISSQVAQVGLTSRGAMEAPEGPLGSVYWREAFWLGITAHPGDAGTMTVAGHLDDTAGRPAGFWTLRQVQPGAEVDVTRLADGVVFRYRISEANVYTTQQATAQPTMGRLYGPPGGGVNDGVPRISLITCTGRFVHGEYDHRFIAFGQLIA